MMEFAVFHRKPAKVWQPGLRGVFVLCEEGPTVSCGFFVTASASNQTSTKLAVPKPYTLTLNLIAVQWMKTWYTSRPSPRPNLGFSYPLQHPY